ncbi:AP2 domain transcription factor AP2IV-1 [Babesia ovis]|uniref:Coatomer subunit zeta n=1 Tax=Babesia ovis TaxID=5869 RepID=A0A9W5T7J2_BABOV|nr:AP2 domain transcription factor AP2IV-1 [Babesia ovis]
MAYIRITQVDAILLLDHQGDRIAVSYYPQHCAVPSNTSSHLWEDLSRQKSLEKSLVSELDLGTAREGSSGCRMVEGHLVTYYIAVDFAILVLGPINENEVLLGDVCTTVKKCLVAITEYVLTNANPRYYSDQLKKEVVCTKLDSVFLVLDDVVDGGIIMESDHNVIMKRLKGKSGDGSDHVPLNQNQAVARSWSLQHAAFGTKRVTQKRRYMLKLIHPEEKHTDKAVQNGLLTGDNVLPKSLLCDSAIRKLVYSNTLEAQKLAAKVQWDAYKCDVKGVRWHPSGSWYVQFNRRNYEHNFFVNCHCYFSVQKYGFFEAKQMAIAYRKRLEMEYTELQETWNKINRQRWEKRMEQRDYQEKEREEQEFLLADS